MRYFRRTCIASNSGSMQYAKAPRPRVPVSAFLARGRGGWQGGVLSLPHGWRTGRGITKGGMIESMLMQRSRFVLQVGIFCAGLIAGGVNAASAADDDYFNRYDLPTESRSVDIGLQPLGYPAAMIGAVIRRDRILRASLEKMRLSLAAFPFRRGADMVDLMAAGKLEAGLLGDMPTILLLAKSDSAIVGLVKRTSTAIVSREEALLVGLKGKRIGYVPLSSAHYTLLRGLAIAGLKESDVTIVPLGIGELPDALARGEIDAFAGWEPAPSIALARNSSYRVIFRGLSSDYFVLTQRFLKASPDAAAALAAAFARSVEWMRLNEKNLRAAARWATADGEAFSGKPASITIDQAIEIARREILDVPSAPSIPLPSKSFKPLLGEFEFLRSLGKLPPDSRWERVEAAFAYDGLSRVMQSPAQYRLYAFDYDL